MLQHNGLIAIIVGAPGCGKTTLSPFISNIITAAEAKCLNAECTTHIIDEFLTEYALTHPDNSVCALHRISHRFELAIPEPFSLDTFKVAETGDLPHYHNECGEVNRTLTPLANAYCFSRVLLQQANVIITGTGISMYRFLPLLLLQPERALKVITPDKELKGYFPNAMTNATKVRTGQGGVNHKRLVSTAMLDELYELQDSLLAEGGYWEQASRIKTFSSLTRIILTPSRPLPQHEIALIKYHLDFFLGHRAG